MPATIQVSYAEQAGGYRIVVLTGKRSDGTVESMIASSLPGQPMTSGDRSIGTPQAVDAGLGQQFYAPQHVLTRFTIGDRAFGLALFPDGYRATIRHSGSIRADCTLGTDPATALPVPSFFPIARADAPYVVVTTPQGKQATATTLGLTGSVSALPDLPTDGEVAAQIRETIRGRKAVADELAVGAVSVALEGGTLPDRFIGVWAGDLPPDANGYAALYGGRYRSGATLLQGYVSEQGGQGFTGWFTGCLPAGALDDTVIATRLRARDTGIPSSPIVIIAPPSAVTAEVRFDSGATVSVPLSQGGGFLEHDGTAGPVRALDAAGHVVATGRADRSPALGGTPPR